MEEETSYTSQERPRNTAFSIPQYLSQAEDRFSKLHVKIAVCVIAAFAAYCIAFLYMYTVNKSFNQVTLFIVSGIALITAMSSGKLTDLLIWMGVKDRLIRKAIPDAIANAPRDLPSVIATFLIFVNEKRRAEGKREVLKVELLADAQYDEFQKIVNEAEGLNIIYSYPGHYSEFTSDEMVENELYVQCQWNVERQYIEALMFSYITYDDDTRRFYFLEIDEDMRTYRGIQSDTISMGFRTVDPDEE